MTESQNGFIEINPKTINETCKAKDKNYVLTQKGDQFLFRKQKAVKESISQNRKRIQSVHATQHINMHKQ